MQTLTHAHAQLLTIKEVASILGLHAASVRTKIRRGELPAVQLGGAGSAIRVDRRELDGWIYANPDEAA